MATADSAEATTWRLDRERIEIGLVAVYLVGLLFYSYPALVVFVDGTRVLRPDWLLSLPLFVYVGFVRREVTVGRPASWALGFLAIGLASAVASGLADPAQFLTVYLQLAYAIGLFVALASLQPGVDAFRAMLRIWVLMLAVLGAYAVYQAAAFQLGLPFADPYLLEDPNNFQNGFDIGGYPRPAAVFEEPSWFASALVTGVAVLVPCVASGRRVLFSRAGQWAALGAIVGGVAVSGALSGYLTLGAAGVLFLALPDTRRFAATTGIALAVPATTGIAAAAALDLEFIAVMARRFERVIGALISGIEPGGSSVHVRYARYLAALRAWASAPVLGVGLGQYAAWIDKNPLPGVSRLVVTGRSLRMIHGVWFEVPATTGLLGLVAFVGTWLETIREEVSAFASTDGTERVLVVAVLALTLVQLVDWSWGFSLVHPYRWGLIGLGIGFAIHLDSET